MNTRRRWLAAGAALPVLAWTGTLRAQARPPVVIGWLATSSRDGDRGLRDAFTEGMAALGWKPGTLYLLEERHADGQAQRLPALAQELAARRPAVIVAWPSASAKAATAAAPTTPVVLFAGDPLATGLVKSLARPDGMITGTSSMSGDTIRKVLEMLIESVPNLQRVGFLSDSTALNRSGAEATARHLSEQLRVEAVVADVAKPEDIEPAMVRLAAAKVQALVVLPSSWFNARVPTIIESALARRWPVAGTLAQISRRGGLFSFAPDSRAQARRGAYFVDRILKGAKPGDLPIEQPTEFELVINLKAARQLGLVMPPSMMVRATEVIE